AQCRIQVKDQAAHRPGEWHCSFLLARVVAAVRSPDGAARLGAKCDAPFPHLPFPPASWPCPLPRSRVPAAIPVALGERSSIRQMPGTAADEELASEGLTARRPSPSRGSISRT